MSTDSAHPPLARPSLDDSSAELAPVWKRIAAGVYDLLVVLALWFATGAAALAVTGGGLDAAHPLFRMALALVTLGYFALSWQYGGQTIGARAWRLRVEDLRGQNPLARTAWLRALVLCLGAVPLGLGTAIAWMDRERRGIQDRVVATRVVVVR